MLFSIGEIGTVSMWSRNILLLATADCSIKYENDEIETHQLNGIFPGEKHQNLNSDFRIMNYLNQCLKVFFTIFAVSTIKFVTSLRDKPMKSPR